MSIRAAIYARVSSEQQATDSTINSQIAALEARLAQDCLSLMPDERFCDEGYSGATPQGSPHFQTGPKVSAKTGSSAIIAANRSTSGSSRCPGMVGMSS
jgi:resolvase-like protein